jgi:hypothetical protein
MNRTEKYSVLFMAALVIAAGAYTLISAIK